MISSLGVSLQFYPPPALHSLLEHLILSQQVGKLLLALQDEQWTKEDQITNHAFLKEVVFSTALMVDKRFGDFDTIARLEGGFYDSSLFSTLDVLCLSKDLPVFGSVSGSGARRGTTQRGSGSDFDFAPEGTTTQRGRGFGSDFDFPEEEASSPAQVHPAVVRAEELDEETNDFKEKTWTIKLTTKDQIVGTGTGWFC